MAVDIENTPIVPENSLFGRTPNAIPQQPVNIGIDTRNSLYNDIADKGINGLLDMSSLEEFLSTARNRDQLYSLIDTMEEDPTISAALETYVEDATEANENGDVIWATSNDPNIEKFVTYLLNSFKANKNMYKWVNCLCKYGDVYLKLIRESEYSGNSLFDENEETYEDDQSQRLNESFDISDLDPDDDTLTEAVNMKVYSKQDPYVYYLEMMPNPAEMFELVKFDESYAYIKAGVNSINSRATRAENWMEGTDFLRYKVRKSDVTIYQATEFVHGYLGDDGARTPEEIQIFLKDTGKSLDEEDDEDSLTYRVRRGQSLFHGTFKAWRELQLLEDSVLLNRVTKSSVVRAIGVEVGDMPKEMVQPHLQGIKQLMEQKSSINTGTSYGSYTNPGPVENNIYIPTRGGVGALSVQQIGGDVEVGKLTDLDYFRDKLFGSLKIPKQYLGCTDDSTGFNGGSSLSLISARYAKTITRIQNTMIQTLTDAINLILVSKGFRGYVNKYVLHMVPPVTQNDLDRRDNITQKAQQTDTIMRLISDAGDDVMRLKALKSLLAGYLNDPDVIELLQEKIDKIEAQAEKGENPGGEEGSFSGGENFDFGGPSSPIEDMNLNFGGEEEPESSLINEEGAGEVGGEESGEEEPLPTPEELGLDFTQNENFE